MSDNTSKIWLEVTNVRIGEKVEVQLKGDKADKEPVWWPVIVSDPEKKAEDLYRRITDGLDKKRTVLASLAPRKPNDTSSTKPETPGEGSTGVDGATATLEVRCVRVQFADSSAR